MLVNSCYRSWQLGPHVPPQILPWSGVVIFWDGDVIADMLYGPNIVAVIDDAIRNGVRATSFQVFQADKPSECRQELVQLFRSEGFRFRSDCG